MENEPVNYYGNRAWIYNFDFKVFIIMIYYRFYFWFGFLSSDYCENDGPACSNGCYAGENDQKKITNIVCHDLYEFIKNGQPSNDYPS